ncbi:RsmE family RNA methyltransferase [Mycoplasmatota bacterium WC30]
MQRYFVEDNNINDGLVVISNSDFHHIKNVMRLKINENIIVTSFSGKVFLTRISEYRKNKVILEIVRQEVQNPNTFNLSIAQTLIKRDNFELVLQKITELGISDIYPIKASRSIIKIDNFEKKLVRYNSIIKEASEQSERTKLPLIHDLSTVKDLPYSDFDVVLVAHARESNNNKLSNVLNEIDKTKNVLVLVGPEGGFTKEELTYLADKARFVSLGKTILRSETAAIYIASAFRFAWEN